MDKIRLFILAALLVFLGLTIGPQPVRAYTFESDGDRVLTGELVITDAGANRFRLVGHGGSFTAPAGTSVLDFDGKPVRVELSRDGRPLQITQMPVHYEPITHGQEILSGELIVQDVAMRTFTVAGDSRLFTAPQGVDISQYGGRMVDVRLDEQGRVAELDVTARPGASAVTMTCTYNGQGFTHGASICQSGSQYRCEDGTWRNLGLACSVSSNPPCEANGMTYAGGTTRCTHGARFLCERGLWREAGADCPADTTTSSRSLHNCVVGGASVASGSSICRKGTTLRCVDGEWANVWTACS